MASIPLKFPEDGRRGGTLFAMSQPLPSTVRIGSLATVPFLNPNGIG